MSTLRHKAAHLGYWTSCQTFRSETILVSKILCCHYFCIFRSLPWLSGLNHTSHLVCLLGKGKPTTRTHIGLFMKYYNFTNFRETSHNSGFLSSRLSLVLYSGSDSYILPNFILALGPNLVFVHINYKMIQICNFDNIHRNSENLNFPTSAYWSQVLEYRRWYQSKRMAEI